MAAGDLRFSVGFYQRQAPLVLSPDVDYGNTEGDFPSTANFIVPANIVPKLGGESILADRLTGKNFVNIIVRQSTSTDSVTVDWRAKDERSGDIFNIRSIIDPKGDGKYFEMLSEKGVAT